MKITLKARAVQQHESNLVTVAVKQIKLRMLKIRSNMNINIIALRSQEQNNKLSSNYSQNTIILLISQSKIIWSFSVTILAFLISYNSLIKLKLQQLDSKKLLLLHNKIIMQQTKFFNTQSQVPYLPEALLEKKKQLGNYVSKLDLHINKARNFQDRALGRKRQNLLSTLQKMKQQIFRQSQRTRKMEQFFYLNCQKLLQEDIAKWDCNKDFFSKMFELYDIKLKQKKSEIMFKKQEVDRKTKQLKQKIKQSRTKMTEQQLTLKLQTQKKKQRQSSKQKRTIQTQDTTTRVTRVKTQVSLPSLSKPTRIRTLADEYDDEFKNYMKPIKTEKYMPNNQLTQNLVQMMNWYKVDRQQDYNWFQKLIFVDRNYKKIIQAITQ